MLAANQIYVALKTVHLAQLTGRTAVLHDLQPAHGETHRLPVSTFFDLARLSKNTGVRIVEWNSYSRQVSPGVEQARQSMSCWRWNWGPRSGPDWDLGPALDIDLHFWPTPPSVSDRADWNSLTSFPALVSLATNNQTSWLESVTPAPTSIFPDPDLLCFDNLFFAVPPEYDSITGEKYNYGVEQIALLDPVWRDIGSHLHFTARVDDIVDKILADLGVQGFIGVHIRRGDFIQHHRVQTDLPSALSQFGKALSEMQEQVRQQGHTDRPIVFLSDSNEVQLQDEAQKLGWISINHHVLGTAEKYGTWMPAVIDSCILSRAIGFVGTFVSLPLSPFPPASS